MIDPGVAPDRPVLGRRLDRLYLGAVEQQLVKHIDEIPVVGSDVS